MEIAGGSVLAEFRSQGSRCIETEKSLFKRRQICEFIFVLDWSIECGFENEGDDLRKIP